MVNPSEFLDLRPRRKAPATARTRVPVVVEHVDESGALEVSIPNSDQPSVVTVAAPGLWQPGAQAVAHTDSSGKITHVEPPKEISADAQPIPVGVAAQTLTSHSERLAGIRSEWQSDVEDVRELAESAPAKALEATRVEVELASERLAGEIESAKSSAESASSLASSASRKADQAYSEAVKKVTAEKIVASSEMWAKLAVFAKVTTPMLTAGNAKITESLLADNIILKTSIIAGSPDGTHTKLDPRGLHVYRKNLAGENVEAIRLGTSGSDDYLGIADSAGRLVSSLDATGGASFQSLSVAGNVSVESLTLDGQDVGAVLAGIARPVSFVQSDLKQPALNGTKHAVGASLMLEEHSISNPSEYPLFAMYVASSLNARVETLPDGREVYGHITIRLHYADQPLGTFVQPGVNAPYFYEQIFTNQESGFSSSPAVVPFMVPPKTTRGITVSVRCANTRFSIPNSQYSAAILAFGAYKENAQLPGRIIAWASDTGYSGYTPPPQKQRFTKEYSATWGASYSTNRGGGRHPDYDSDGVVVHGLVPGVGRLDSGLIGFPDMTRDLAGATVEKIEVYLYFSHWWNGAGGTAGVGIHNALGMPGSLHGGSRLTTVTTGRQAGRWVTLPSSVYEHFKSGAARGILLMPGSANQAEYGLCRWRDTRLRITFSK